MSEAVVREWIRASRLDLDSIQYIIHVEHLTPIVAFHAQQAIEKALKALLESKNIRIPKTHKLQTLIDLADFAFEIDDDLILMLDDLYIDSRYPGDFGLLPNGNPTIEDAKTFYKLAEDIHNQIKGEI